MNTNRPVDLPSWHNFWRSTHEKHRLDHACTTASTSNLLRGCDCIDATSGSKSSLSVPFRAWQLFSHSQAIIADLTALTHQTNSGVLDCYVCLALQGLLHNEWNGLPSSVASDLALLPSKYLLPETITSSTELEFWYCDKVCFPLFSFAYPAMLKRDSSCYHFAQSSMNRVVGRAHMGSPFL